MITVSNTRSKLIREYALNEPWMLWVDNTAVGEWRNCRAWSHGIEGDVNGDVYRIETVKP